MFRIFSICKRNKKCSNNREIANLKQITYEELLEKVKTGVILLDVRTKQEFNEGHLNGAIVIPYYDISKSIKSLVPNKEQEIIVYCKSGNRSSQALEKLESLGYSNVYDLGSIDNWEE